jgi:transposase-like protein
MEERRSYSKEFKLDVIELSNDSNKSVKVTAADLDI